MFSFEEFFPDRKILFCADRHHYKIVVQTYLETANIYQSTPCKSNIFIMRDKNKKDFMIKNMKNLKLV